MNGDSKYKLFRNYMVNELGIGRDDIERWVKESVLAEVGKLVGQMNLEEMVRNALKDPWSRIAPGVLEDIKKSVARDISQSIQLKLKE